MNQVLAGRELYVDDMRDQAWLRLLFTAAGIEPQFTVSMNAKEIIAGIVARRHLHADALAHAREVAGKLAARRHRAEADARHLAAIWQVIGMSPI
jgi:hypothetical protein